MTDDPVRAAREQINKAMETRIKGYANSPRHRSRWGAGLEGQRLPGYRVAVTEQTRRGRVKRHTFVLDEETWESPGGPHWHLARRQYRGDARGFGDPLPLTVNLAPGVDIPAAAFTLILDALVSGTRHSIDLAEINAIVSQLGPRLIAFGTLDAQRRQLAEPALYSEILARCSSM